MPARCLTFGEPASMLLHSPGRYPVHTKAMLVTCVCNISEAEPNQNEGNAKTLCVRAYHAELDDDEEEAEAEEGTTDDEEEEGLESEDEASEGEEEQSKQELPYQTEVRVILLPAA
eukprot:scaffold2172_cov19-Tisochrysis_lutea.AAC.1